MAQHSKVTIIPDRPCYLLSLNKHNMVQHPSLRALSSWGCLLLPSINPNLAHCCISRDHSILYCPLQPHLLLFNNHNTAQQSNSRPVLNRTNRRCLLLPSINRNLVHCCISKGRSMLLRPLQSHLLRPSNHNLVQLSVSRAQSDLSRPLLLLNKHNMVQRSSSQMGLDQTRPLLSTSNRNIIQWFRSHV
jgi:hypothetical protein